MKEFGVEVFVVMNVVGGVNELYFVGDLMLIFDYINFIGMNLFIGLNDEYFGLCFLDMFEVYNLVLCVDVRFIV